MPESKSPPDEAWIRGAIAEAALVEQIDPAEAKRRANQLADRILDEIYGAGGQAGQPPTASRPPGSTP